MPRVLVVFSSKYGQASKIAEHVGQEHRRRGHLTRVLHVDVAGGLDLTTFDAFVLVAPVYFGKHPRAIRQFVRRWGAILGRHPSAFVSVSNSAASADPAARANAMRIAEAFVNELPWVPRLTITAGGALAYPRYNWALRFVMKRIARAAGAPTDTSRTHELTDWGRLDEDVRPFCDLLRGEELTRHDDLEHAAPAAQ